MSEQNRAYACWVSELLNYEAEQAIEINHNLTLNPQECFCDLRLKCFAKDESGHAVGDYTAAVSFASKTLDPPAIPTLLSNKITLQIPNNYAAFVVMSKADGNNNSSEAVRARNECWQLELRIWYPKELAVQQGKRLSRDTVFYVYTGGDDAFDGLSEATAWATLKGAIDNLAQYNCQGFAVTLQLGVGRFESVDILTSRLQGCRVLLINGKGEDSVVTGYNGIRAFYGNTEVVLANFALDVERVAVAPGVGGIIRVAYDLYLKRAAYGFHCQDNASSLHVNYANIYVDTDMQSMFVAQNMHMRVSYTNIYHRVRMNPVAYLETRNGGCMEFMHNSFVNPDYVTGKKFSASANSTIQTFGTKDALPGNMAGVVVEGAVCV